MRNAPVNPTTRFGEAVAGAGVALCLGFVENRPLMDARDKARRREDERRLKIQRGGANEFPNSLPSRPPRMLRSVCKPSSLVSRFIAVRFWLLFACLHPRPFDQPCPSLHSSRSTSQLYHYLLPDRLLSLRIEAHRRSQKESNNLSSPLTSFAEKHVRLGSKRFQIRWNSTFRRIGQSNEH